MAVDAFIDGVIFWAACVGGLWLLGSADGAETLSTLIAGGAFTGAILYAAA